MYNLVFLIGMILINIWNSVCNPPAWMVLIYTVSLIISLFIAAFKKEG